jgi:hypothetical protein
VSSRRCLMDGLGGLGRLGGLAGLGGLSTFVVVTHGTQPVGGDAPTTEHGPRGSRPQSRRGRHRGRPTRAAPVPTAVRAPPAPGLSGEHPPVPSALAAGAQEVRVQVRRRVVRQGRPGAAARPSARPPRPAGRRRRCRGASPTLRYPFAARRAHRRTGLPRRRVCSYRRVGCRRRVQRDHVDVRPFRPLPVPRSAARFPLPAPVDAAGLGLHTGAIARRPARVGGRPTPLSCCAAASCPPRRRSSLTLTAGSDGGGVSTPPTVSEPALDGPGRVQGPPIADCPAVGDGRRAARATVAATSGRVRSRRTRHACRSTGRRPGRRGARPGGAPTARRARRPGPVVRRWVRAFTSGRRPRRRPRRPPPVRRGDGGWCSQWHLARRVLGRLIVGGQRARGCTGRPRPSIGSRGRPTAGRRSSEGGPVAPTAAGSHRHRNRSILVIHGSEQVSSMLMANNG